MAISLVTNAAIYALHYSSTYVLNKLKDVTVSKAYSLASKTLATYRHPQNHSAISFLPAALISSSRDIHQVYQLGLALNVTPIIHIANSFFTRSTLREGYFNIEIRMTANFRFVNFLFSR